MRIQCLQHVPFEGPACVGDWAVSRGHEIATTLLYKDATLPEQSEFDMLFLMGGPMGVHDEVQYPWLEREKEFLRRAIRGGKLVVGICLGAQLIADALGAPVHRNEKKEIGWLPIELTEQGREAPLLFSLPHRLEVFHWHGDTFGLPEGSVHLARSEACEHQAFLYEERVLALQFHLESTRGSVADIVANCTDEIIPDEYIQDAARMLAATGGDYVRVNEALFGILDRLSM